MRSIGGFLFLVLRLENTDLFRVYVWVRVCGCLGNRWKEKEREREREGERIKDKGGYRRLLEATYIPGYRVCP